MYIYIYIYVYTYILQILGYIVNRMNRTGYISKNTFGLCNIENTRMELIAI